MPQLDGFASQATIITDAIYIQRQNDRIVVVTVGYTKQPPINKSKSDYHSCAANSSQAYQQQSSPKA